MFGRAVGTRPTLVWSPFRGPVRRVVLAGVAIVVLVLVAVGVSVWRSEGSATLATSAISDQKQLVVAVTGGNALFEEQRAFADNVPLSAADRRVVAADGRAFADALAAAVKGSEPGDRLLLQQIGAALRGLDAAHAAAVPLMGHPSGAAPLRRVHVAEKAIDAKLDRFITFNRTDAAAAQAQSQTEQSQSVVIALVVGGAAVLLAIGLVSYIISLLVRFFRRIREDAELLEQRVQDIEAARRETLERLALAAEYRDDDTLRHTERVGRCAALIARRMGLASKTIDELREAAPLHDVGKLGVSDTILLKPGRLTSEERESMQRHAAIGAAILAGSDSPVLNLAQEIALSHHERWDGAGYPFGLAGAAIPISARIVALADVFDALTHERPYKHAWPLNEALDEIRRLAGEHFDPEVVAAFFSLGEELAADIGPDSELAAEIGIEPQAAHAALVRAAA